MQLRMQLHVLQSDHLPTLFGSPVISRQRIRRLLAGDEIARLRVMAGLLTPMRLGVLRHWLLRLPNRYCCAS